MQLSGQTVVRPCRRPLLGPRLVMAEYRPRAYGVPVRTWRTPAAGADLPWSQFGLVLETSAPSFRPAQARSPPRRRVDAGSGRVEDGLRGFRLVRHPPWPAVV